MVNFTLEDLEAMTVRSPHYLGNRAIVISDYTTEHLDDVGAAWQCGGGNRLYTKIPQNMADIGGYMVAVGEKAGVTGIDAELIRGKRGHRFQIKAPMSLDENHWVGFVVDVDDKGNATVLYMDSLSDQTDISKCREEVKLEYARICAVLEADHLTISKDSGVYQDTLQQSDIVSCGPFFMENASRALGNSNLANIKPSEVQIRAEQLPNIRSKHAVKSVSVNMFIADKMFELARHKDNLNPEDLDIFLRDEDFKRAMEYEYELTADVLRGRDISPSNRATYLRALGSLNKVLAQEKSIAADVEEALKRKLSVDQIEEMVTAKWLESLRPMEDAVKKELSSVDVKQIEAQQKKEFLRSNKGLIKTDVMRVVSRVIEVTKVHDKSYFSSLNESFQPSQGILGTLFTGVAAALTTIIKVVLIKPLVFVFKEMPLFVTRLFTSKKTDSTEHKSYNSGEKNPRKEEVEQAPGTKKQNTTEKKIRDHDQSASMKKPVKSKRKHKVVVARRGGHKVRLEDLKGFVQKEKDRSQGRDSGVSRK